VFPSICACDLSFYSALNADILILAFLVINPGDLYYLVYKNNNNNNKISSSAGLCSAFVSLFLSIYARPIILKSTAPILIKSAKLVEPWL